MFTKDLFQVLGDVTCMHSKSFFPGHYGGHILWVTSKEFLNICLIMYMVWSLLYEISCKVLLTGWTPLSNKETTSLPLFHTCWHQGIRGTLHQHWCAFIIHKHMEDVPGISLYQCVGHTFSKIIGAYFKPAVSIFISGPYFILSL